MRGGIAVYEAQFARLAGGSCAELEHDRRRHIARSRDQRRVVDEDLVAFDPGCGWQALLPKVLLEPQDDFGFHPVGQTGADLLAPLLFLALTGRERRARIAD